jgi:hypothetical protein
LLQLLSDFDGQFRFGLVGILGLQTCARFVDFEEQGEGDVIEHSIRIDRHDPVGDLPNVADVLGCHIIRGFPLLAISCLINAEGKRSSRQCLFQLGQPSGSQVFHLPWGIRHKVMQRLRIALARRLRNSWQRLAFDLGEHSNLNLLEVFKAPHVREHILVELAILVDKGHGRSGRSRLGHNCSPLFSTEP